MEKWVSDVRRQMTDERSQRKYEFGMRNKKGREHRRGGGMEGGMNKAERKGHGA
jgi:hypothetical protein